MIIDPEEINNLETVLRRCWGDTWSFHMAEQESCLEFLAQYPHLLIPLGFCEARVFNRSPETIKMLASRFKSRVGYIHALRSCIAYRRREGGWYLIGRPGWQRDKGPPVVPFYAEEGKADFELPIYEPVSALRALTGETLHLSSLTVFPTFPTRITVAADSEAAATARAIIGQLQDSKVALAHLKPYELEDVVAELMRARGHKIIQTKRTRDGGRDLIVFGEFFPGMEVQMAVEVTTLRNVGIKKVSQALHQNRHFPLIMVATSGRFSAGVMREFEAPDNRLKLQLVSGVTLWEWIRSHGWC